MTQQQQGTFTLSDISPNWAKRLGEQQLPAQMSITWFRWWLEMIWPPKCVVGEAYGFTRSYTNCCGECGKIGDKFSLYFSLKLYSKLEENKQRFVNHWNKEHALLQSPCTVT
ncbi:MAG TPA: hypothetical protein VFI73_10285 [Candidatus Nitrosopolaris sp.]|nr:hypothetical protein [Candidatus Nitrosopolaris sp.]